MDETTFRIFQLTRQGHTCGQIILKMGRAEQADRNPPLVRAMAGLAYGGGSGLGSCGALAAGCCLLAIHADARKTKCRTPASLRPCCFQLFRPSRFAVLQSR